MERTDSAKHKTINQKRKNTKANQWRGAIKKMGGKELQQNEILKEK